MSQQRFSLQFREALWDVHDHRCIYCMMSLLFMEMEVDHVVPEQLLSDPPMLAKLTLEMALASSFDVLGYENLAPSCGDCNGKKHGRPNQRNDPSRRFERISDGQANL
jgi:5-methylcytosine-specific restriction endonuclease McrA